MCHLLTSSIITTVELFSMAILVERHDKEARLSEEMLLFPSIRFRSIAEDEIPWDFLLLTVSGKDEEEEGGVQVMLECIVCG